MPERKVAPLSGSAIFSRDVGQQEDRKLMARRSSAHVWPGLGMLGLIGWSVCLPALVGAWLGAWLDHQHPGRHAWTLPVMVAGLCLGCANAWYWVSKEQSAIHLGREREK